MVSVTLRRFASATLISGVAGLALATPAAAMVDPAPPPNPNGRDWSDISSPTGPTDDSAWVEIAAGAAGGLVLAGLGIAATVGLRRRSLATTS